MDFNVDFFSLIKMGAKLATHKAHQYFQATSETHIRTTSEGKVKGVKRKTIYGQYFYTFEGIPYAKPPIGELRFRTPQPMDPWEGVRDCVQCQSKPMQVNILLPIVEGSEDCLYLNIYAKRLESPTPLPVIIWIHGGAYQFGEASKDFYAPDYLMQHDIVLVSITYRLNALGFLSFDDPDLGVPGNAGIKDQIMAVQWIKRNIHNFNGDTNNITVMGESAGATSTQILMMSPQTKGLFHKAIVMSGSVYCSWAVLPQRNWAYRLACKLGYKGGDNDKEIFRYLNTKDARKIVEASGNLLSKEERRENFILSFGPTMEAYESEMSVIRKPIQEMLRESWSHEIPLLIGGTSFEGLFCYMFPKNFPYLINEMGDCSQFIPLDAALNGKSPEELLLVCKKLKEHYFGSEEPHVEKHFHQYLNMMSPCLMWNGIYRTLLTRLKYAKHSPTYLYRFDYDSPNFNHFRIMRCGPKQRGVAHADDLSYIFYNALASKQTDSGEAKTINRMTGILTSFANLSNPNCKEIESVNWEPINDDNPDDLKCLNISNELKFLKLPELETLKIWTEFYTKENLV